MSDRSLDLARRSVSNRSRRLGRAAALSAALLAAGPACVHAPPPASKILEGITHEGYTPNKGLSGLFQPGNLIQTMEMDDEGKLRKLSPPLILAWGSDCFPGLEPRESPFVVEQGASKTQRDLSLEGPEALALIPGLSFGMGGVAGHRLTLQNPRVRAFAKADVSGKMSQKCIDAIADAVKAGDRPEWFTLVLESIVVDSLRLEIDWGSNASAEVRDRVTQQVAQVMDTLGGQLAAPYGSMPGATGFGVPDASGWGSSPGTAGTVVSPDGTTVVGPTGTTVVNPEGTTVVNADGTTVVNPDGTTVINPDGTTVVNPGGTTIVNPDGTTVVNPDGTTFVDPNAGLLPTGGVAGTDLGQTRGAGPKRSLIKGARAKIGSSSSKSTVIELGAAAVVAYRTRRLQAYSTPGSPGAAVPATPAPPVLEAVAPPPADAPIAPLRDTFQASAAVPGAPAVGRIAIRQIVGGKARRVRLDHPFRSGDAFQLEVSSSRDGFLYLLHAPPGAAPKVLWPRIGAGGRTIDKNAIRAKQPLVVPPAPGVLRFDDEAGQELMYAVIRPTPEPPDLGSAEGVAQRDPAAPAYLAVAPELAPAAGVAQSVQYAVRGANGARVRGVVFDAGAQDPDPSVYFSPPPGDAANDSLIEFRLNHAQ